MALDQRGFRDIKEAAHQMGPQLEAVVEALKAENTDAAAGIASKLGGVQLILRQVVASAHVTPGPMGFFDVVAARQMLQAADPLNPNEPPAAAAATAWNTATRVNAALDAVVNVNQAIANAGTGGIVAAVNELVARANDAVAIHAALK